jgi:NTP pyrophosphatase (non-canonical NTP hydrolase)
VAIIKKLRSKGYLYNLLANSNLWGGFDMNDFGLNEMQEIQKQLQEKYKDKWGGLSPDKGRNQLLWMMIEVGEVADIIKKKGDNHIMNDEETRNHFLEELCDVLMYFNDVMLCYSISPEELKKVYLQKHNKNIERW